NRVRPNTCRAQRRDPRPNLPGRPRRWAHDNRLPRLRTDSAGPIGADSSPARSQRALLPCLEFSGLCSFHSPPLLRQHFQDARLSELRFHTPRLLLSPCPFSPFLMRDAEGSCELPCP